MQHEFPLTVHHALRRMGGQYADRQVATHAGVRTFGDIAERVERLGAALVDLGVRPGDRVASFAWNTQRHLELYYAVPCVGAVLHTVNVRLFPDQVEKIMRHAEDTLVFVDEDLAPALAPFADRLQSVRHFVGDGDLPRALRYEDLIAGAQPRPWPDVDERAAAALSYTSGTTGEPKGVLYSHRSLMLHATGICMAESVGISSADRLLCVVPMFHVNGWGFPFAAGLTGASLVLPGREVNPRSLAQLIAEHRPTIMNGVPTVFADLLGHGEDMDLTSLRLGVCGGSAVPPALIEAYDRRGVSILHAWGMTETSSICTVGRPRPDASAERRQRQRRSQGALAPWVELRIVAEGEQVPWDGEQVGEIQVRGPWVAAGYFGADAFEDGWLRTGDIGAVDPDGFVRLTDRTKDLIKSGGEWISSVELENQLMGHPDVAEAAVIAAPDERWGERPLACVVTRREVSAESLRAHLEARVPKWWLPERFAFVDEIPKTATFKFDKKRLRSRLARGELPV